MVERQKEKGVSTTQVPAPKSKKNEYALTLNCSFVNVFRKIFLGKIDGTETDTETGGEVLTVRDDRHALKITATDTDTARIIKRSSTAQILDFLLLLAHRQGRSVIFNVNDYMQVRALTDKKEARKQLFETLQALAHCRIEYSIFANKKESWQPVLEYGTDGTFWHIVAEPYKLGMGTVQIDLSETFYRLLHSKRDGGHSFKYPVQALAIKTHKTANAYIVAVMLALQYNKFKQHTESRETGTGTDKRTAYKYTNTNRVRIARFLPLLDLPSIETVRTTQHRHFKKYIQIPFENILNALTFIQWHYVDWRGNRCEPKTFEAFWEAKIDFIILHV